MGIWAYVQITNATFWFSKVQCKDGIRQHIWKKKKKSKAVSGLIKISGRFCSCLTNPIFRKKQKTNKNIPFTVISVQRFFLVLHHTAWSKPTRSSIDCAPVRFPTHFCESSLPAVHSPATNRPHFLLFICTGYDSAATVRESTVSSPLPLGTQVTHNHRHTVG